MMLEDVHHCLPVPVFGGEEGAFLNLVSRFWVDAHGCKDGGVKVFDGYRIFDSDEWTFIGSFSVDVATFNAAAKHRHTRTCGEMTV